MNKIGSFAAALLLLFPCLLSAQSVTASETQLPKDSLTNPQEIVNIADTLASTSNDSTKAIVADSLQPKPEATQPLVQAAEIASQESDNKNVPNTVKTTLHADNKKLKRFWGGTTAGITYNDFHSTHFGLRNIKHSKEYKITVNGSDDLLNSFWGIGFRVGMSGLYIPSPYFSLHGDLALALRQGTGKTNLSVILAWPDAGRAKQKSDLKIEYSATQLNIDMPILARVSIPNALYFEAGPMVSFNVYSKSKAEITDIFGTETYEQNGDLSAAEFDIVTGVGATQNIGKSMIDFDLRLVIGLTRISDGKDSPKTWQGQLNVTYWFL